MNPSIITGVLSAGGAAIIIKLIDVIHDSMQAHIRRKEGRLSLDEKVDAIVETQKGISKQLKQTDEVVLATARDRIIYLCRQKEQGKLYTPGDVQEIDAIYQPYHADGGNHAATVAVDLYLEQAKEWQKRQAVQE